MQLEPRGGKLTRGDLVMAKALKAAPFVGFAATTIPLPIVFFLLYLFSAEGAAFYMLLTLSSLGLGAALGLVVALILFLYRRRWEKRLRTRLAEDGITVDELPFFMRELKTSERLTLRRIEGVNEAMADAYRETLAARLTATRLLTRAKRELVRIDGRIARAKQLKNADTRRLQQDLDTDRRRIEEIKDRAEMHLGHAQAQLQTIEAATSRTALRDGTDIALQRLGSRSSISSIVIMRSTTLPSICEMTAALILARNTSPSARMQSTSKTVEE